MRKYFTLLLIFVATTFLQANEFWLQPKRFSYAIGDEMKIDFITGEHFTGSYWDAGQYEVAYMQLLTTAGKQDLRSTADKAKGLSLKATKEGTYLFAMQSRSNNTQLQADQFNEFLKTYGQDEIIEQRKKLNQTNLLVGENITHYAKLLVQVGAQVDDTFKQISGLQFEIIPEQNPYTLKTGDYLGCKVYYEGKPVPFALVKVWSMVGNTAFLQNIYTEKDGSIRFPIGTRGPWMVSSVKVIAIENNKASYHSLCTSLTFGIQ